MKDSPLVPAIAARLSRARIATLIVALGTFASIADAAGNAVGDERSVPGTVVPSTGTTAGAKNADPASPTPPSRAGSLGGSKGASRCSALRKQYADSQACFERFRLQNGGLRPGASRQCKQVTNPSVKCGSEVVG